MPSSYFDSIQHRKADNFDLFKDYVRKSATTPSLQNGDLPRGDIPWDSLPTLVPALTPRTETGLTVVYITLYAILFVMVYVQLWMVWFYRHRRFSYQTVFLFLCLIWASLRTTLFSFYFNDCTYVNTLAVPFYWLLFCFPVCLQFITLCLLVLFFAQVVFKSRAKFEPSRLKRPLKVALCLAVLIFVGTNLTCAVIVKYHERYYKSIPAYLLYIRVAINDTLFIVMGILMSVCIYKMAKISAASVVLEAKGTTKCQALTACILIILLYTSRAVYNLIAVCPVSRNRHIPSFGYNWINVSDQADLVHLDTGYAFVSFGIVLFVWEICPTFIVIVFFRVKKPNTGVALNDLSSHSQNTKAYFFDNPRRYDSDDDLSRSDMSPSSYYDGGGFTVNSIPATKVTSGGTPRGTPRVYGSMNSAQSGSLPFRAGIEGAPAISTSHSRYQDYYDGT